MSKVLLIEDDRFLIEDLQTFIEFEGHSCTIYSGADEVIEQIDRLSGFDVIILDIMMPRGKYLQEENLDLKTGEILFQRIRAKYPDTRVLIISAKNFGEMHIDFAAEDNVSTISKPFDNTASEIISQL